ncbi:hypothetical protein SVXHr_0555 [Halorhabdus sp. SVX81]|uniref:hypothetical protein n=1 Tax=Halorhabdus sp. SVX81 TaxID=2978283 RepID=UPI0023DB7A47|nr:hypothetical protein [Halorhabdus sp. SVX81]WEL16735.1 hypothetical protein SVXHr_0555 [Halorhabdus sp. SVX81]
MVLENLTLFEVHLDNARIGPGMANEDEPEPEATVADEAADADDGRSIGRLVIASIVVSIVVSVLAWALTDEDEQPDVAIDAPEETDSPVDVAVED